MCAPSEIATTSTDTEAVRWDRRFWSNAIILLKFLANKPLFAKLLLSLVQNRDPGQRYFVYEETRHDGHKGRDRTMSIVSTISR